MYNAFLKYAVTDKVLKTWHVTANILALYKDNVSQRAMVNRLERTKPELEEQGFHSSSYFFYFHRRL
jgi:hypothetical protein